MKKWIVILAVLAIGQVLLTVFNYNQQTALNTDSVRADLAVFDVAKVDQLQIKTTGQDNALVLKKQGEDWILADGFPADAVQVNKLLNTLSDIKTGLAVAASDAAAKRLKVADGDFERHISVLQGDNQLASIYLGSGAGARRSYIRRDGEAAIYTAELGSYDVAEDAAGWQNKNLLQTQPGDIQAIQLGDLQFKRMKTEDENAPPSIQWTMVNELAGKKLDQKAINHALAALSTLRYASHLGTEAKAEYGFDQPLINLQLTLESGERIYQLGQIEGNDEYIIKMSARPEFFQLASHTGQSLVEKIDATKWVVDITPATTGDDEPAVMEQNSAEAQAPILEQIKGMKPPVPVEQVAPEAPVAAPIEPTDPSPPVTAE